MDNTISLKKVNGLNNVLQFCHCKLLLVTGTFGKTVCASLLEDVLQAAGYKIMIISEDSIVVDVKELENVDFLIVTISISLLAELNIKADMMMITNVSAYPVRENLRYNERVEILVNYISAMEKSQRVILNENYGFVLAALDESLCDIVQFSTYKKLSRGSWSCNGEILVNIDGQEKKVINVNELFLPGKWNLEAYYIVILAALFLEIPMSILVRELKNYSGTESYYVMVSENRRVGYYNNMFSCKPCNVVSSLTPYSKKVILITSGDVNEKGYSMYELSKAIMTYVKQLIVFGDVADEVLNSVKLSCSYQKEKISFHRAESIAKAVQKAHELAKANDVVIFSPAIAKNDSISRAYGNEFSDAIKNIEVSGGEVGEMLVNDNEYISDNQLLQNTPFGYTMKVIGGKWKMIILYVLAEKQPIRFNEIKRFIGNIAYKTLSQQLKELESYGVVYRKEYPQIPPKVEYYLTDKGMSLVSIIDELNSWGVDHQGDVINESSVE